MRYNFAAPLTLTKHLCHTSAPETVLMQRKNPPTFRWLGMEEKTNQENFYNYYVWITGAMNPKQFSI